MKTRLEMPYYCVVSLFVCSGEYFEHFNPTFLTENDIPGASLLGRKPDQLKISELKFWHKSRGEVEDKSRAGEASARLHKTLVSGASRGRNCFLLL